MSSKVYCLILHYNRLEDTVSCIRSLLDSALPLGTKILVVDNGRVDYEHLLTSKFKNIIYLKSKKNLGYGGGNNLGITYAQDHGATHILLINPDVTVGKGFLPKLLARNLDLVAPAHFERVGLYGLGGHIDWQTCSFPHDNVKVLPKNLIRYELVTFACVLINTHVFKSIGLFDERYFMYLEDVDFCHRASLAGYQTFIDPTVSVRHRTSSSFSDKRSKLWPSLISHLKFITKWYPRRSTYALYRRAIHFYLTTYLHWTREKYFAKSLS